MEKIDIGNLNLKIYSFDLLYEYDNKKNKSERENKINLFGIDDNIKKLNQNISIEFFIDNIFKIILVKHRPSNLMVICG